MNDDLADLRARYERLRLLHDVGKVIHSTLEPQQALELIVREAVRVMRAASGSVVLLNPTNGFLEISASHGLPETAATLQLRLGEGITGWVARAGKPARVGNVAADSRYILLRPEVQSELAVPLEVNGEIRGVINVDADRPDAFSASDEELLQALANEAARVIHNTWLYEQLRLKARLFESLVSVSRAINSAVHVDEALSVITSEACVLMQARMCSLMLLDPSGQWLDLRAHWGAGEAYVKKPRLSVADSLLGVVLRRKKPVQLENVQTSSRYQNSEVARLEGLFGLLSVPLLFGGKAIGTLSVYTGHPYSFSNEEVSILAALAELSAIAIQKAQLYERVVDTEEQLRTNEKLSALGLLAAEVAHEIRNPLTVMKMLYHSLDLNFPQDDPRGRDAKIISEKIEHLNRIVDRILSFARSAEPQPVPADLNGLIQELILLVRHKLKHQRVQLVQELSPDLPCVLADTAQLGQAFLNVILNAAEAMPEGGTLTLSTTCQPGPVGSREVVVQFRDTGPGMTRKQQERALGAMLATTKPKGTGLGLAIVSRIVEAHQGRLEIKSRPGHGTTIRIILPLPRRAAGSNIP